jgi:hypothetical protein
MVARVPADASVIPRDPNARRDPNPNALGITLKRDLTRKDTIGSQKIVEGLQAGLLASNARVLDLFRAWDTDNDGRVSREEFHAAFRAMASDHPERLIDETFDAFGAHAYTCRNRRVHNCISHARRALPLGAHVLIDLVGLSGLRHSLLARVCMCRRPCPRPRSCFVTADTH